MPTTWTMERMRVGTLTHFSRTSTGTKSIAGLKTHVPTDKREAPMKWVTRKSIRVNRMATAWLIRRFIDPQAMFLFVEPDEVVAVQQREGAKGFDAPEATYPHQDEQGRCSFEALVEEHCSADAVLDELARVVRGADFAEETGLTPESAGLRTISHGFPLVARDDHEVVEKASFLYDALYAALKDKREENT